MEEHNLNHAIIGSDSKIVDVIKSKEYVLDYDEYLITPNHPTAKDYRVFYKDQELKDVIGVIEKK